MLQMCEEMPMINIDDVCEDGVYLCTDPFHQPDKLDLRKIDALIAEYGLDPNGTMPEELLVQCRID